MKSEKHINDCEMADKLRHVLEMNEGVMTGTGITYVREAIKHLAPQPIPFTHETWPKQVVWLRFAGNGGFRHGVQVIDFFADGVCLRGTYRSFEDLMTGGWEMSLDFCQTWQPCHYVPES